MHPHTAQTTPYPQEGGMNPGEDIEDSVLESAQTMVWVGLMDLDNLDESIKSTNT
jgi:hypothetical protein